MDDIVYFAGLAIAFGFGAMAGYEIARKHYLRVMHKDHQQIVALRVRLAEVEGRERPA